MLPPAVPVLCAASIACDQVSARQLTSGPAGQRVIPVMAVVAIAVIVAVVMPVVLFRAKVSMRRTIPPAE